MYSLPLTVIHLQSAAERVSNVQLLFHRDLAVCSGGSAPGTAAAPSGPRVHTALRPRHQAARPPLPTPEMAQTHHLR